MTTDAPKPAVSKDDTIKWLGRALLLVVGLAAGAFVRDTIQPELKEIKDELSAQIASAVNGVVKDFEGVSRQVESLAADVKENSKQVAEMKVEIAKVSGSLQTLTSLRSDMTAIRETLTNHLSDPEIHHTKLRELQSKNEEQDRLIDDMKRRVERLEDGP